ncbi:hypothetical protein NQZ68_030174 [Dissostichus eleginoides]|nr:hypothetical protein NQZ68_030174 [Dissostichus eleginoides]
MSRRPIRRFSVRGALDKLFEPDEEIEPDKEEIEEDVSEMEDNSDPDYEATTDQEEAPEGEAPEGEAPEIEAPEGEEPEKLCDFEAPLLSLESSKTLFQWSVTCQFTLAAAKALHCSAPVPAALNFTPFKLEVDASALG